MRTLLQDHTLVVVKPIVVRKQLVKRASKDGPVVSRRSSPKRGTLLDLFDELVHFTRVFPHPRLTLEVPLVDVEEWRYPGHGRRRRWRASDYQVEDQKLLAVHRTLSPPHGGRPGRLARLPFAAAVPHRADWPSRCKSAAGSPSGSHTASGRLGRRARWASRATRGFIGSLPRTGRLSSRVIENQLDNRHGIGRPVGMTASLSSIGTATCTSTEHVHHPEKNRLAALVAIAIVPTAEQIRISRPAPLFSPCHPGKVGVIAVRSDVSP